MRHSLLRYLSCLILAAGLTLPFAALAADADWRASDGRLTLDIAADVLADFGLEVRHDGRVLEGRARVALSLTTLEPIGIRAPWDVFRGFETGRGRLAADARLTFRYGGREVRIDRLLLEPGESAGHPQVVGLDGSAAPLFTLTHLHLSMNTGAGRLQIDHAEVEASPALARRLGFDGLANLPFALGTLELAMERAPGAETQGAPASCTDRPIWPQEGQYEAHVVLTAMSNVIYDGTEPQSGRIKIVPSATLKNESLADVPWIHQFDELSSYPYDPPDQHPILLWNLYRLHQGRFEMLAGSGAKHAFFTVNSGAGCLACPSENTNYVLWPQCEDMYGTFSNDLAEFQGPREEIRASLGEWDSCGSFFDPGCSGSQTQFSGEWLHRLLVDPAELQVAGASYFVDAWYVVQYDADIWNTMGYLPVNPAPSRGGWLMNPGVFAGGPVLSAWVDETDADPLTDHDVITIPSETPAAPYPGNMPQGHLRLAVRVTEVSPGRFRYNYALQNFDFDRALEGFRVSIPAGSQVFETYFGDVDEEAGNDWVTTVSGDQVLFEATAGNELTWFTLFNFEIETDAPPVNSLVRVDLGNDAVEPETTIETLGPAAGTGLLFQDRFIDLAALLR